MQSLKEYLEIQADEALRMKEEREQIIKEWTTSIYNLIGQVRVWLNDADPHHILEISTASHRIREEKIGGYDAPGLIVRLNAREVRLIPISRYNVGPFTTLGEARIDRSFGRVDLTEGGLKYTLYRIQTEPSDKWILIDDEDYIPRVLDRKGFEEAVLDLFR